MRRFDILVEKRNGELEDILKKTGNIIEFPIIARKTEERKKTFLQLTESSIENLTEENWKILRKYGLDSKEKILKLAKETYEDQHSCNLYEIFDLVLPFINKKNNLIVWNENYYFTAPFLYIGESEVPYHFLERGLKSWAACNILEIDKESYLSIYLSTFFISNQYLEIKKRFLSCGFLHEIAENKFGLTHHYEPDYKYKCLMYPYSKVEELVEYLWSINPSNLGIENFLCEKCRKALEICSTT